ncbi:hypothetical protein ACRE_027720 [Hapsidospora chrysogenum ATCC 11550]|uniref:Uncharacterized protein n=1 Tax=Hapsidospora chrysogenum (strain ATCC 11550 / CBS 779.69 / DSM 880 / IAM 14645 / JCM 23072 / IMI 49137) TaxID=857340 RepID=A0A086TAH6_HAPC1|nr:hypothetical protein ACRE_027720 [Hapsidospora chrysogenum ATCC 11550]
MILPRNDLPDDMAGDAGGTTAPGVESGTEGGALGGSGSAVSMSTGGLVAIVVVVVVVAILGIVTGTLFFVAKKREWTMKETLRRSARKVKTALTPRRAEFPSSVKDPQHSSTRRGRARIPDDVPPTPKWRSGDVEKGQSSTRIESNGRK